MVCIMRLSYKESAARRAEFNKLREAGYRITAASQMVGVTRQTGSTWEKKRVAARKRQIEYRRLSGEHITPRQEKEDNHRQMVPLAVEEQHVKGIPGYGELCPEARRALRDFDYFRRRYFGRIASPWQVEAAQMVEKLLHTPEKEYVVVNAPPGSGKSTLFTHDIPAWLACKDRAIRCLIGSRTERQGTWYTRRLRTTFERLTPPEIPDDLIEKGLAVRAEATLTEDFGYFKPMSIPGVGKDPWRAEEFTIAQPGDAHAEDKESSFAAFGMDGGFLGGRFSLVIWDDLVDKTNIRTVESREKLIDWYETEAETRLEPGGLLVLQGQRMSGDDLYRHALNLTMGDEEDGEEVTQKYKHVLYKAHYVEKCENRHKVTEPPWPEGCLLDPRRVSWRDLRPIMANKATRFRVLYQQEDVDPASVLVQWIWVEGGRDENGLEWPGCFDDGRRLGRLPEGVDVSECISVCTADPSPTKNWAIQWWLYHPGSEQRFLIDFHRGPMEAPELLDWLINERRFVGLMEEWQLRSLAQGAPIQTWIVEVNAAQKFLLQYDHVKRWQIRHGVNVVAHTTGVKKLDDDYGIPIVQPHWKFGRYRLPGRSKAELMPFLREVTRYELGGIGSRTDDCVMANWFLEVHLPALTPPNLEAPEMWTPSWLGQPALVRSR